jgi:hypothetical protein
VADRNQEPHGGRPVDPKLEAQLRALGRRLRYPPEPDVHDEVLGRIEEHAPLSRRRWRGLLSSPRRRVAAVVLALLFAGASALGISPDVREATAERLGLKGIKITFLPQPPKPEPVGSGLKLGEKLTLEEARRRVAYRIVVPSLPKLGEPDAVYVGGPPPPGGQVSLVYRPRSGIPRAAETGVGVLLTEFQGSTDRALFRKILGPGVKLEAVSVNGGRGYWLEGDPHVFLYQDGSGYVREERIRLAANTLIWEQGELTLRLEGKLPKEEALRIAESVR